MIIQERPDPLFKVAERLELEAVVDAIGRSSRPGILLRYVGERHLNGESDQLTEYKIATEVFGRSMTIFDAGKDSIVRVEAHRLRKRLKKFYEGAGKDHSIEIAIPFGTYIPSFTSRVSDPFELRSGTQSIASPNNGSTPVAAREHERHATSRFPGALLWLQRPRNRILALLVVTLLGSAAVFYTISRAHRKAKVAIETRTPSAAAPVPNQSPGSGPFAVVPLRLLAGYSGAPQTDSAGKVWSAEQYVHGGGPWRNPDAIISRTSDPFLFEHWRAGDSSYDIPLRPGIYELQLYFVAPQGSSQSNDTFTIRINDVIVLSAFDISSDALGEDIADERVFHDVSPGADGMLHIALASEGGAPLIAALELLPGIPHKQLPIRLVMQHSPYTDQSGQFWHPDDFYMNGRLSDRRQEIAGSPDPDLFSTERYGHFTYAIPVDPRDRYTLTLHFVEFYYGAPGGAASGVGSRLFRVMCNGQTLLDNFDIYKEAGSLHALAKTFSHLKPSAQGKLNITFEPITNNATVSGIEVLDESQ